MVDDTTTKLAELVGGIFGDVFGHPIVRLLAAAVAAYALILWIASAWWAMQDMRRRHREPAAPYLAAALVILSTPLLFPLALLVYHVARPSRTLGESRLLQLEEQLDELEREGSAVCAGCGRSVEPDWLSCPACRSRLAYRCLSCERAVGLDWTLCAWCGAEFGGRRALPVLGRTRVGERRRAGLRTVPTSSSVLRRALAGRGRPAPSEGRISAET